MPRGKADLIFPVPETPKIRFTALDHDLQATHPYYFVIGTQISYAKSMEHAQGLRDRMMLTCNRAYRWVDMVPAGAPRVSPTKVRALRNLTGEQLGQITDMLEAGNNVAYIGRKFGVPPNIVAALRHGLVYAPLADD
jgi:hypothetical protein